MKTVKFIHFFNFPTSVVFDVPKDHVAVLWNDVNMKCIGFNFCEIVNLQFHL